MNCNMVQNLFLDIWRMTTEMAPYLLLGFLLAGLMHEYIPRKVYANYLGQSNFRSVLLAALFGVPLPLCSCGVLPTAMGLRREGGSRGATVSFLIATPQTGVDSIIATFSLMGLPFTIIRPIAAFLTAIFGGTLVNAFENESEEEKRGGTNLKGAMEEEGISSAHASNVLRRLPNAIRYGFVEMMADIGKWLIMGLIVAGVITAVIPDQWFSVFKDNSLLSILLVLSISIPMYVCATGSIPIAVALMMKGLTPGAALVLLMAGPACNVASLLVINKVMGRRTLLLYLSAIVGGAILFGLGIDYLLPNEWFTSALTMQDTCCNEVHTGWFSIASALLLFLLLANALLSHHHHTEEEEAPHSSSPVCEYSIQGMHCSHCSANVERAIRSVEGVEEVNVSLDKKSATMKGVFDKEVVRQAIESIGYEVK